MSHLIVNGDDFGASHGINRGIATAHVHGILTSASLMVSMSASRDAAKVAAELPELDVGLHVQLTEEDGAPIVDLDDRGSVEGALDEQLDRFYELVGSAPTHIDSHHNVHFRDGVRAAFLELADRIGSPLRGFSDARYLSSFYGQWDDGSTHLEQVSVDGLLVLLDEEASAVTELGCHPGYVDPSFATTYSVERAHELGTLCDPRLRNALHERGIELTRFRSLRMRARAARGVQ
jgi:predicted glycoside hydrolase/deacetylase ChbG (UPF0249 family)